MRVWRTIRLVAGGGMVVVLGAAAMMLWPLLWPPDPDASVQLVNGRLIGETSGYVGRVDRTAQTVDISSSLVGWRPILVVVNDQTAIMVQNRQGGFGDLMKDLPVRVSYEVMGDRRLARAIEVVTEEGERARAAASGPATGSVTPGLTSPAAVPAHPPVGAVTPPAVRPLADAPAPRAADVTPPRAAVPAPPAKAPTVLAPDLPPRAATPPAPMVREPAVPTVPPPAAKPTAPAVREPVAPIVPPPAPKPPAPMVREASPRVEPAAPRVSAPVVVEPPSRVEPPAPRVPGAARGHADAEQRATCSTRRPGYRRRRRRHRLAVQARPVGIGKRHGPSWTRPLADDLRTP